MITKSTMIQYDQVVQRNYGVYSSKQQKAIKKARIAVVGIGCDGGLVAMMLARVGVGHLSLIDFDIVEVTNLNRQPLCTVSALGRKKVDAAREILLDSNPCIEIAAQDCRITIESAGVLSGHDVILQCVDNFPGRVAIHRLGHELGIPVVSMTGQPPFRAWVSTFLPDGPPYEEVMQLPSLDRQMTSDVEHELNALKVVRARNADVSGATEGWCEAFIGGLPGWGGDPVGWGITPERAYITGVMQAHEALRLVTGRRVLASAPHAIIIDLSSPPNIVQVRKPANGRTWSYREY